jgi:hypothetical protein
VTFGGTGATSVVVVNPTTITCTTPPHAAGPVDVVVSNDFGSDTLLNGFMYTSAPTIISVTPLEGPIAGGTNVTLAGANYTTTPDTTVTFGGTAATNVVVVNATLITCTTPAHAAGAVDVTVTNSNGSGTLPGGFTYHAPPVIISLNPDHGPMSGGTAVTLTGNHFTPTNTFVTIGGNYVQNLVVVDNTTLTFDTPASPTPGPKGVYVLTPWGDHTLLDGFTYTQAPTITSVTPSDGSTSGNTAVTILGNEFTTTPDTTVTFGGILAANVLVVDVNTITCDTPAHTAGAVDVTVTNSNGSDTLVGGFTYHNPPTLISVNPNNGPPTGGTAVTLSGTNFTALGTTTVTFGGTAATAVVVVDATTITCDTPAHVSGTVDVVVTNDFGSGTLVNGYTFNATTDPLITAVTPSEGPVAGNTAVTIEGDNFTTTPDTILNFGGSLALNVVVVDVNTMTCNTPAHAAGSVNVTVVNSNGTGALLNGFTYHAPPVIVSLNPDHGPMSGGTPVTLAGNHFTPTGTYVTIGNNYVENLVVVDPFTLTFDAPASPTPGPKWVYVLTPWGDDSLAGGYTYDAPPTLTSVTPSMGLFIGGTPVTLSGSDFLPSLNTEVHMGGMQALNVVVVDANTITCDTPASPIPDLVDVEVSNNNGSDLLTNGFEFVPEIGAAPLNLTDVDTVDLYPFDVVRLAVTGQPGSLFFLCLSLGGGPVPTKYGIMGLNYPIFILGSGVLNANGYLVIPMTMPDNQAGYFNFFTHAIVDNGPPVWALGGNNPNGSGSILWGLH